MRCPPPAPLWGPSPGRTRNSTCSRGRHTQETVEISTHSPAHRDTCCDHLLARRVQPPAALDMRHLGAGAETAGGVDMEFIGGSGPKMWNSPGPLLPPGFCLGSDICTTCPSHSFTWSIPAHPSKLTLWGACPDSQAVRATSQLPQPLVLHYSTDHVYFSQLH